MPGLDLNRMRRAGCMLATLLGLLAAHGEIRGQAVDRVQLIRGMTVPGATLSGGAILGEVVAVSPTMVELLTPQGQTLRIPVDQIRELVLADAPEPLRDAQAMVLRDDAAAALAELGKLTAEDLAGVPRLVIAQADFVGAAAAGKLAAATGEGLPAAAAGLRAFLDRHPQSHLVHAASEILADVLARQGDYAGAARSLAPLAAGPPSSRVRAAVAQGNLLLLQGDWPGARGQFETAVAIELADDDKAGRLERIQAALGRARCLAREGRGEQAVEAVRESLAAIDPSNRDLLARGYATLGEAFRAVPNGTQDAILAFLRVDLIFNSLPDAHAEALSNLADLWARERNPERARACRQALETTYPDSGWTRRLPPVD
jgi:tetratricopeptide (TPR) repeat protein